MIHILIDNASYPEAAVLGVYKDYNEAKNRWDDLYREDDPFGPGVSIVSWNIITNTEAMRLD